MEQIFQSKVLSHNFQSFQRLFAYFSPHQRREFFTRLLNCQPNDWNNLDSHLPRSRGHCMVMKLGKHQMRKQRCAVLCFALIKRAWTIKAFLLVCCLINNELCWVYYYPLIKELSHCILSSFGGVQNYLTIEGNPQIVVYWDRKTS